MDESEYKEKLAKFDLDDRKLCAFITNETGAIIKDKHLRGYFSRSRQLSEPMTGLLRFAFKRLEEVMKHVGA